MNSIARLADTLDTLPLVVRQAVVGVVQTLGEFLLDYNRAYLADGVRPDGTPVDAGGYSPGYAAYRAKYGLQTAVKDLKFTGEYYKGFRLPYLGGGVFEVENEDAKAAKLLQRYGELYGIREQDIEEFIRAKVVPEIELVIQQHMKLV